MNRRDLIRHALVISGAALGGIAGALLWPYPAKAKRLPAGSPFTNDEIRSARVRSWHEHPERWHKTKYPSNYDVAILEDGAWYGRQFGGSRV